MKGRKASKSAFLYFIPFLLLAALFIIVPLAMVVLQSFKPVGQPFSLDNFKSIFSNEYFMLGIRNSLWVSFLSSVIGIVISFLVAFCIYRSTGRLKSAFIHMMNVTSNFQGIQLAFAFMLLLGNSGVLVLFGREFGFDPLANYNLYNASGIVITFVYFQIPLGTLLLYPSFDAVKKEFREAAMILNANDIDFWTRVGIPILLPGILGTFAILFANAIAAYATPYALLGNNFPLLPIQISSMFTGDVVQQVDIGSALSVLLLVAMGLVTIISGMLLKKDRGE